MSGYSIPCPAHGNIKVRWDVEVDHVTITQSEDEWIEEIHIPLNQIDEFFRAVRVQAQHVNRSNQ